MDIMEAIVSRRSVRKYKPDVPEEGLIQEVLKAGCQAPSGGNRQPWRFIIVREKISIDLITTFSPGFAHHPTKPPIIIIICSVSESYGEGKTHRNKAMMDTYLAAENIVLAAVGLGLGTVMVRSFPESTIKDILGIPEEIDLVLLIGLGYPDEGDFRRRSKKPVEEMTFNEKYGKGWSSI